MDREHELKLLEELVALKSSQQLFLDDLSQSNPVNYYVSRQCFLTEQERIFQAMPRITAHTSEIEGNNRFLRRTISGKPLLLLRGDDGVIRVFLNVCRHRGTRLVDAESGCKRRLTCPYHGWTWDSSGQFVNAPHFEAGFPDVDRDQLGLTSVRSLVHRGFVWLLPEDFDDNLGQWLDAMDSDLAWAGTDELVVHATDTQQRQSNWKILVETGLEAYHFRVAHRKTIAKLFNDNLSSYQCFGPHIRSVLPRASIVELADQPCEQWHIRQHSNVLLTVFPSSSFLIQSDHVIWISMEPLATNLSEVRIVTLKPRHSTRSDNYWNANHDFTVQTLNEDFDLAESIQSGLGCGANQALRFGRFEGALHRFNETVKSYIG